MPGTVPGTIIRFGTKAGNRHKKNRDGFRTSCIRLIDCSWGAVRRSRTWLGLWYDDTPWSHGFIKTSFPSPIACLLISIKPQLSRRCSFRPASACFVALRIQNQVRFRHLSSSRRLLSFSHGLKKLWRALWLFGIDWCLVSLGVHCGGKASLTYARKLPS